MLIGYARVSTLDQKLDLQSDALTAAGCDEIFSDIASGARDKRPGLDAALERLQDGDTLIVWKLDRLGRSLAHLVATVSDLAGRGVDFRSVNEKIDTTTPGGKLVFHIFAAMAEFERELIRERTHAGLTAARARGRKGGAKLLLDDEQTRIVRRLAKDHYAINSICSAVGISRRSYFRYMARIRAADAANESAVTGNEKAPI